MRPSSAPMTEGRGGPVRTFLEPSAISRPSGAATPTAARRSGEGVQSTTTQAVIIDTVDGGQTWAQVATPPGVVEISAVTCLTDGRCVAIGATGMGDVALISTSTGSAWTQAGSLPAGMAGARDVACSNDLDCWVTARSTTAAGAVSGAVALTTDGGASWTAVPTPAGTGLLNGISCIAGATTGNGAVPGTTTVAGGTGSSTTAPVGHDHHRSDHDHDHDRPATSTVPPVPVVGVAGVRCTAVGTTSSSLVDPRSGHGVILTTANGGASWTQQPISGSVASLADVSCTAVNTCVAVGSLGDHRGRPGSHDSHRVHQKPVVTIVVGVDSPTAERRELRFDLPVRGCRGVGQRVFRHLRSGSVPSPAPPRAAGSLGGHGGHRSHLIPMIPCVTPIRTRGCQPPPPCRPPNQLGTTEIRSAAHDQRRAGQTFVPSTSHLDVLIRRRPARGPRLVLLLRTVHRASCQRRRHGGPRRRPRHDLDGRRPPDGRQRSGGRQLGGPGGDVAAVLRGEGVRSRARGRARPRRLCRLPRHAARRVRPVFRQARTGRADCRQCGQSGAEALPLTVTGRHRPARTARVPDAG